MKPIPTGKLVRTDKGYDLILTRTMRAPIEDVWASITEPERTARWFGPWEGTGKPGNTIKLQMVHEEGQPWMNLQIEACSAPTHLAVSAVDDSGTWRMEAQLAETDGTTELNLIQHVENTEGIGSSGPGWEYYLDILIASREDQPLPAWDDYYPSQQEYYDNLTKST
jgi:uncharacterized protein YndB with AHSA1/START domain